MKVPFVDLQAQYQAHKIEIDAAIHDILDTSQYMLGPGVRNFEKAFAKYIGVHDVIAVSDGTNALQVALRALAIGRGDEVIVPAHTFVATAEAVSLVGATPVFVDVDPHTHHLTAGLMSGKITERTKAVIPVHLYGHPVDLDPILELAKAKNIFVIEDAAQAQGSIYKGKYVGGSGTVSCFSFYPGKNLGTYGEGGAVATNNEELAGKIRLIHDHGSNIKYQHDVLGGNFRMSGIEGAVLGAKLPYLDGWNESRRAHAAHYRKLLDGVPVDIPRVCDEGVSNYHLFTIQTTTREQRDALQTFLKERDIATGVHYPIPCHMQPVYAFLGHTLGDFSVSEKIASTTLSLPMYAELTREQIIYVTESVKEFFN